MLDSRIYLGKPDVGPAIARSVLPSDGTNDAPPLRWQTANGAMPRPDGTATTRAGGQILQTFPVPPSATVLSGKISIVSDTWHGAVVVHVVWQANGREVARQIDSFSVNKKRPTELTIQHGIPASADHVMILVHPWRPQDGRITVGHAIMSWYHPAPTANGQWPLLDPQSN